MLLFWIRDFRRRVNSPSHQVLKYCYLISTHPLQFSTISPPLLLFYRKHLRLKGYFIITANKLPKRKSHLSREQSCRSMRRKSGITGKKFWYTQHQHHLQALENIKPAANDEIREPNQSKRLCESKNVKLIFSRHSLHIPRHSC